MKAPLLIAITLPHFFDNEGERISTLLQSGVFDRVHLRKPGGEEREMRNLIESIPPRLHSRLSMHDFHEVATDYGCGIHINARNPQPPEGFNGIISRSCHSLSEISTHTAEDYLFLSPIYPSISKPGYRPGFDISSLKGKLSRRIIALGGITPDNLTETLSIGFGGVAMLGTIWEEDRKGRMSGLLKTLLKLKCFNS